MGNWKSNLIGKQDGQTILITGASSGLGLEAATVLSAKNAKVIMAVRNLKKGREAAALIKEKNKHAKLEVMHLDLSDLDSIYQFSKEFSARYSNLNVLINNAGVMYPKVREATKQGFEIQFGTNHLGHFLLTGLLIPLLKKTPQSRVVTQSSNVHKGGDINFKDLNGEKNYNKTKAYSQSKLANLLFAYELDRRFKIYGQKTISVASHPGYTATNLQDSLGLIGKISNKLMAQTIEMGTLPVLRAATEEHLTGSEFFGPTKMFQNRGFPEKIKSSEQSYNIELAQKLWEVSEQLVGFKYIF